MTGPGATAGGAGEPSPLVGAARALMSRAIAFAERAGDHDLAHRLEEERGRDEHSETTLVVVGETKRGKSSLINALLGRPGLVPVEADVATNVAVIVRHGPEVVARVVHAGAPAGERVEAEAIADWATEAGNPGNARGVELVEVWVPDPLLERGLAVVDTPGVGGIGSRHLETTLQSLGRADALLFVTEAGAPVSEPELSFLTRACERIATAVVVVAKVDAVPDWRAVWDANRRLLEARSGPLRTAAVLPVSSRLKTRADVLRDAEPALARDLHRESGVEALRTAIAREVLDRRDVIRVLNVLRLVQASLERLSIPELVAVAEPAQSDALRSELERAQAHWQSLGRANASWTVELNDEIQDLRLTMSDELTRAIARLGSSYDQLLADRSLESADVARRLSDDLRDLSVQTRESLHRGVEGVLASLAESLGLGALGTPEMAAPALGPDLVELTPRAGSAPQQGSPPVIGMLGPLAVPIGLFSSVGAYVGLGFAAVFPFGAAAGGILVGLTTLARRRNIRHQEARAMVQATMADASTALKNDVARRLLQVQRAIREDLRAAFERLSEDAKAAIARQQQLVAADRAQRERARSAAEARLATIRGLSTEIDRLAAALLAPENPPTG